MTITRLAQAVKNPSAVTASSRTAAVSRLLTSTRARAASLAKLDASVNAVFAKFADKAASFTAEQLGGFTAALREARAGVNAERQAALSDLHLAIRQGIPNAKIAAQYDDLTAVSAKIAALLVQACATSAEGDVPAEQLLTEIDSNGYVVDEDTTVVDPLPSGDEDQSLATTASVTAGEGADTNGGEAANGGESGDGAEYPAQAQEITTPEQAVTAAVTAGEGADTNGGEAANGGESGDGAEYPAQAQEITTPEQAVTASTEDENIEAAIAGDVELPEGADLVDETEVVGGDDENEDVLPDSFVSELDLPDSGIDQVLADEILDPEQYLDEVEDEEGDEVAASAVASRGGHVARQRRLASASRTNPRASDEGVLASLGADILS